VSEDAPSADLPLPSLPLPGPGALRAAVFDAVGTLIELAAPVGEVYARVAGEHGVELPAWRLGDAFARVLRGAPPMVFADRLGDAEALRVAERDWWRRLVRSTFLAADGTARFADFDAFFAALWQRFAQASSWRCRTGTREALVALAGRGLRLGLATNFDHRIDSILEDLGIMKPFEVVARPGTTGFAKPDPRLLLATSRALGVPPGACACVGDSPADREAARRAGFGFVDARGLPTLEALPTRLDALATLSTQ